MHFKTLTSSVLSSVSDDDVNLTEFEDADEDEDEDEDDSTIFFFGLFVLYNCMWLNAVLLWTMSALPLSNRLITRLITFP